MVGYKMKSLWNRWYWPIRVNFCNFCNQFVTEHMSNKLMKSSTYKAQNPTVTKLQIFRKLFSEKEKL